MTKKSQELIKITYTKIDHELIQTVDARELHAKLESKRKFSTWMLYQIDKGGFIEDKDYIKNGDMDVTKNSALQGTKKNHGNAKCEYYVTIDVAKHIAMMSHTEYGKIIRQYFIDKEKEYWKLREQQIRNHQDPNWQPNRIEGKIVRHDLTDAIKQLIIYAKDNGSKNPQMYYIVYTKLVNQLFEFNDFIKTQKDKRNYMNSKQLVELSNIENKLTDIIYKGIENSIYYKDIYLTCKEKIDKYVELFGTSPVVYQLSQTQYSLLN